MRDKRSPLGDDIYQEPSGAISVKWTDPVTGKQIGPKVIKGITNKTEAKKWRRDHVANLLTGKSFRKTESISHLADRWLASRKDALDNGQLKDKTYAADEWRVRTVRKHFGIMRVDALDTEEVRLFLKALRSGKSTLSGKGLSPKPQGEVVHCLEQMIDFKIAEEGGSGFNPVRGLARGERPKQQRQREPIELTPEQVEDFLYLTKEHHPAYLPLFTTIARTGMRIREALALTWGDIDPETKQITVTTSKQRASAASVERRVVPLYPQLESILGREGRMAAKWSSDDDFVFSARPGSPKSYRNVRRALRSISEKMGFGPSAAEHLHSHDFRHSLTRNVRGQITNDLEKLSFCRSMGWKDTTMFDKVYGQSREEQIEMARIAADVVARAMGGV